MLLYFLLPVNNLIRISYLVNRISYVSVERIVKKKEDKKTKAMNILFSFLLLH